MASKNPEHTQPRNPHQLTKRQHVHSRCAVERFAGHDGTVQVLRRGDLEPLALRPDNDLFVAKRAWSHGVESGLFKSIEDRFNKEVDDALRRGRIKRHDHVSEYLCVWRLRARWLKERPADVQVVGLSASGLTKDQEEILERKGAGFVRRGGIIPGRVSAGFEARMRIDRLLEGLADVRWGVVRCDGGEFLCADAPGNQAFIPLTPSVALVAGVPDRMVGSRQVARFNGECVQHAIRCVFSQTPTPLKSVQW